MYDNALDPRVDDASLDRTEIADVAASFIVATIQARVGKRMTRSCGAPVRDAYT